MNVSEGQDISASKNNILLCLAWICSALVIGFLLWFFTLSFRTRLLTETVNRTLAGNGGGQIEMRNAFSFSPASVLGGTWFPLRDLSGDAFVFTIMRNGTGAACIAIVDNGGRLKTILPLSSNARQIVEELPLPVYRFYADRIEQDRQNRKTQKRGLR